MLNNLRHVGQEPGMRFNSFSVTALTLLALSKSSLGLFHIGPGYFLCVDRMFIGMAGACLGGSLWQVGRAHAQLLSLPEQAEIFLPRARLPPGVQPVAFQLTGHTRFHSFWLHRRNWMNLVYSHLCPVWPIPALVRQPGQVGHTNPARPLIFEEQQYTLSHQSALQHWKLCPKESQQIQPAMIQSKRKQSQNDNGAAFVKNFFLVSMTGISNSAINSSAI